MGLKKWLLVGAVIFVLVITGIVAFIMIRNSGADNQINIYFFNSVAMRMEAETRPLVDEDTQIQAVIGHLHSGPARLSSLTSTWPQELAPQTEDLISAAIMEDSTLFVFLLPIFNYMQPLDQSLFKAALIHSLRSLPVVNDIKIVITSDHRHAFDILTQDEDSDGDEYEPYAPLVIYDSSHPGVLIDPFDPPISPHWIDDYTFTHLHFVDITGTGLVVESYEATGINRQPADLAISALELLIDGPRHEESLALIPPETRILNVEIDNNDIYVNLSSDFVTRFVGTTEMAELMIYSIVNTLLAEVSALSRVHFLIDTQQVEQFHEFEDFHMYFTRDNTRMLSYILEREAEAEDAWDELEQ